MTDFPTEILASFLRLTPWVQTAAIAAMFGAVIVASWQVKSTMTILTKPFLRRCDECGAVVRWVRASPHHVNGD